MDASGLRHRKTAPEDEKASQGILPKVAAVDVFPKVPADLKKRTKCGALLTIICCGCMLLLVLLELEHYLAPEFDYAYSVDTDFGTKLPLSIDMTVAMPCEAIGADIVDLVNENVDIDGGLNEEPAYFELTPEDLSRWKVRQNVNQYLSEEYHALHKILWHQGYKAAWSLPAARKLVHRPGRRPDACRFYGLVHVNKMAGNLHVLAGKALHGADLHAHISLFVSEAETNFSHRIERLGFGAHDVSIVNPLDGEEKVTTKHSVSYQYNLKVVPTQVYTRSAAGVVTYQYGVQSMERILNHSSGSHGIPGIFIKYDMNPLKISVVEQGVPFFHFLVRICGIIGGIFATTGILSSLVQNVLCRVCGSSSQSAIPHHQPEKKARPPLDSAHLSANALLASFADDKAHSVHRL